MRNEKQHAHQLLEQLEASQLAAVVHLLEVMVDPVAHSTVTLPIEDEEITEAMAAELDEAHASIDRGEGVPHEELLRHYGLTRGQ
jgi:hypothetical protein